MTEANAGGVRAMSVQRVRRAFEAAFARFCTAGTFEEQEDEASNMLHHLFRLFELLGGWGALGGGAAPHHAAALVLYRHKDTHEVVEVVDSADVFSDVFTDLFGTLVWTAPPVVVDDRRYDSTDAAWLAGKPVVDTLREAFYGLLQLADGRDN